eukprot:COSAG02_NODE_39400_length_417_cov_1.251572_1_plen_127_part_01
MVTLRGRENTFVPSWASWRCKVLPPAGAVRAQEMQAGTKPVGGRQNLRNSRARRSQQTAQHHEKTQPLLSHAEGDSYEISDSASRPASPARAVPPVVSDELTEHADPYKKNEQEYGPADWMKPPPTD